MNFEIGQRVKCIKTWKPASRPDLDFGEEDQIYTIKGIMPSNLVNPYLMLEELGEPGERNYYVNSERFVPLGKTITFTDLDLYECEHILDILNDYRTEILENRLKAHADTKENLGAFGWYTEHLKWHDSIMKKLEVK